MEELKLIRRAEEYAGRTALRSGEQEWSYQELLDGSAKVAAALLDDLGDLEEGRVAFMAPAGYEYVAALWGIWRAGGVAVPLSLSATAPELEFVLADAQAACVVTAKQERDRIAAGCGHRDLRLLVLEDLPSVSVSVLPPVSSRRRAMILYTSGTTSRPKGVVTTHANIQAQIDS